MPSVTGSISVAAPADVAWAMIGEFNGLRCFATRSSRPASQLRRRSSRVKNRLNGVVAGAYFAV